MMVLSLKVALVTEDFKKLDWVDLGVHWRLMPSKNWSRYRDAVFTDRLIETGANRENYPECWIYSCFRVVRVQSGAGVETYKYSLVRCGTFQRQQRQRPIENFQKTASWRLGNSKYRKSWKESNFNFEGKIFIALFSRFQNCAFCLEKTSIHEL